MTLWEKAQNETSLSFSNRTCQRSDVLSQLQPETRVKRGKLAGVKDRGREGLSERETTANNHRSIAGRVVKEQNGDWDRNWINGKMKRATERGLTRAAYGRRGLMSQI